MGGAENIVEAASALTPPTFTPTMENMQTISKIQDTFKLFNFFFNFFFNYLNSFSIFKFRFKKSSKIQVFGLNLTCSLAVLNKVLLTMVHFIQN